MFVRDYSQSTKSPNLTSFHREIIFSRSKRGARQGCEIEPLTQHENVGHDIAVAAGDAKRLGMTAEAGVGIGRGDAVEVAREDQRIIRVGERRARAFGQGPAAAFLACPLRGEEFLAKGHQFLG